MKLKEYIKLIKSEGLDVTVSVPGYEGKETPEARTIRGL